MSAKTDPAEFADAEIIKDKLEKLNAKLDLIIGHLEALQASIGVYAEERHDARRP